MSATLSQRLQALVDGTSSARPPRRETPEPEPAPASTSSQPILRWLGSWTPYRAGSPDPDTSSPPSPGLSSLNEALTEPIVFPPSAHLPEAFTGARALHRPPPFLDSLTRTTLPTASVSPPAIRSSVAALRSVSQRDHRRSQSLNDSPRVESTSLGRWWFQSENKDNVDTLLGEEDRAETVQQEQQLLQNKYRSTKNPVVFCHGLLGFDSVSIGPSIAPMQISHWWGIREVLESNGTEVLITKVPATSSPEDRAKVLEELISAAFPGRSVHLIGHSMGGLDCSRKFKVLSITTIATPHRGSSFADHFLTTVGAARMPSVLSLLELLPNGGGDGKAFQSLTLEAMRRFNEETPDVPDVKYFSWGATYQPGLIDTWKWPHSVVLEHEGENDGLVSVASAQWGKYCGTIQNVSHLNLVGWINPAQIKWAEIVGREITFRPATFYLGIVDRLAEEVEGQPPLGKQGNDASSSSI
uniref:GPI inositol-deacylase n=1 Tax=Mycena chlorophos TaxID=658473 RepID=A0ABQ0L9Q7_MYCCL|nr:predicted protein [Mycena chlorophos]